MKSPRSDRERDKRLGIGGDQEGEHRSDFPDTYRAVLHHIQTHADSRSLGIAVTWATRMGRV